MGVTTGGTDVVNTIVRGWRWWRGFLARAGGSVRSGRGPTRAAAVAVAVAVAVVAVGLSGEGLQWPRGVVRIFVAAHWGKSGACGSTTGPGAGARR